MLKKVFSNIGYFVVMLSLGFVIYYYFLNPNTTRDKPSFDSGTTSTQSFFSANLVNENGVNQDLSQYKGKIIVLNFWATWCPPCREEMPELSKLHSEYNNKQVVVLGIAVDSLNLVKEFSQNTPVSYPLFAAEDEGMSLATNLGNDKGVLPYTVIINTDGKIVETYLGRISKALLETALNPLLPH